MQYDPYPSIYTHRTSLLQTLNALKIPLLEDGRIVLGEAALLLRTVRPFAVRGDASACELRDLLTQVLRDGVITPSESNRICRLIEHITTGGVCLDQFIRTIPDFPKPGMTFHDTTGILDTPRVFNLALDMIGEALEDVHFDLVASPEARGLIFGAAVAARFGKAFVPVCRPGKLPRETISDKFDHGGVEVELQMHADAVIRGERVLIVDDVLATGGTAAAVARLVQRLGGRVVKMVFPIEIERHMARENALKGFAVASLVKYPDK